LTSAPELSKHLTTSQSPIIDAINNGDCPSGINLCDEDGKSPLYIASEEGECDVVKSLLSSGADINLCDEDGKSPLYIASFNGECDVVECLLSSVISAPELSKHSTTSHFTSFDAINNSDCPRSSHKLISAPELSKHLTTRKM
jgi:ankyrin repeat protein